MLAETTDLNWAKQVPGEPEALHCQKQGNAPQIRNKVTEVNLKESILIKSRTILAKDVKCEYSHEEYQKNPKLKDIL